MILADLAKQEVELTDGHLLEFSSDWRVNLKHQNLSHVHVSKKVGQIKTQGKWHT